MENKIVLITGAKSGIGKATTPDCLLEIFAILSFVEDANTDYKSLN